MPLAFVVARRRLTCFRLTARQPSRISAGPGDQGADLNDVVQERGVTLVTGSIAVPTMTPATSTAQMRPALGPGPVGATSQGLGASATVMPLADLTTEADPRQVVGVR